MTLHTDHLLLLKSITTHASYQFELPAIKYEFNKRNFIVRSLFNCV